VGDPDPAVGLVEEPGFDMGDDRDDGRRVVALDQESKAVGEDFPADAGGPDR
jgi:hypothetical protein